MTNTDPLYLGVRIVSGALNQFFNGSIDDVKIFNRALSAQEVSQLYNSSKDTINTNPSSPGTNFLNQGLVGFWDMNNNHIKWSTNIIQDMSGNSNNGQLISMSTTTSGVIGKTGSALRFNGSTQYLSMGNVLNLNSGNFTLSSWVYSNSSASRGSILTKDADSNRGWFFGIHSTIGGVLSAGRISFSACANTACTGTGFTSQSNAGVLSTGKWNHIVYTKSGTSQQFYLNGAAITTNVIDNGSIGSNTASLQIGARSGLSGGFSDYLTGSIDQVRIYNRALSANEVKQLYTSGQ